ncbi:hypothetical protein DVR12_19410 [Chitinophaga silvatica]|uniref:Uncharacterized protein n=1 Tax=Chitinophaga silvatica TaxID=2282649 RepID=A0A3E1Y739_9BACT|nr:hypothetical protein DVR12_19410 [Chitinophaga silvatica]
MKNVALIFLIISGIASALPTIYYMPAKENGACTVQTLVYYSIAPDTFTNRPELKRIKLATEPGICKEYVIYD